MVGHSGNIGAVMMDGYNDVKLWTTPVADQAWNVTNMGDINFDGVNDAGVGTLYSNNYSYFMDGSNGSILKSVSSSSAVDAISSIPDIVGDNTREMMVGGREGELTCLSGGYPPSMGVPHAQSLTNDGARIYPNPFRDDITLEVKLQEPSKVSVRITDLLGRTISTFDLPESHQGTTTYRIGKSRLGQEVPGGTFIMNVTAGQKQYHFKVMAE
jgi:hypothetical protein